MCPGINIRNTRRLLTGKTEDAIGESESTAQTDTRICFLPTNNSKINVKKTNNELCSSRVGADKAIDTTDQARDRMSDTQLASGLLFYRLTKIQTQNRMPKCPSAPHAEKPLSKQGNYEVKFK